MATASKILSVAKAELGVKERPANSNKVKYNTEYYGSAVSGSSYPWCCAFVWWVFKHADASNLFFNGEKTAYCPAVVNWGRKEGLTVPKSSGKAGDIVLFDWNGDGVSDHIGIIQKKNADGSYLTIEGNTAVGNDSNGGEVMQRTRYQNTILCIIRPKYTRSANAKTEVSAQSASSKLAIDGSWGKATTKKTQKVLGTLQDGIVSSQPLVAKSFTPACSEESWVFTKYAKGSNMVKAIQKLVGADTVDGKISHETVRKIQKFLKKKKLYEDTVDGSLGPNTVKAWQKYINSRL